MDVIFGERDLGGQIGNLLGQVLGPVGGGALKGQAFQQMGAGAAAAAGGDPSLQPLLNQRKAQEIDQWAVENLPEDVAQLVLGIPDAAKKQSLLTQYATEERADRRRRESEQRKSEAEAAKPRKWEAMDREEKLAYEEEKAQRLSGVKELAQVRKDFREEVEGLQTQKAALSQMEEAHADQKEGWFTMDRFADLISEGGPMLAKVAEGLKSPSAKVFENSAKTFLLGDMDKISARGINQYMERMLRSMLPQISNSKAAQRAVMDVYANNIAAQEAVQDAQAEILDEATRSGEPLPANLDKAARERAKGRVEYLAKKSAVQMREAELEGLEGNSLRRAVDTKVEKGTPLTPAAYNVLRAKYGKENVIKRAKTLGYEVYDPEELAQISGEIRGGG